MKIKMGFDTRSLPMRPELRVQVVVKGEDQPRDRERLGTALVLTFFTVVVAVLMGAVAAFKPEGNVVIIFMLGALAGAFSVMTADAWLNWWRNR